MPSPRFTEDQLARLNEALMRTGMSVKELCERYDLRPNTVGDIFNGTTKNPQPRTIREVCAALGVNLGYVQLGTEPKWIEPGKSPSAVELRPVPTSLGIDRWLADTPEGRSLSDEERTWMRDKVEWPDPYHRYDDATYWLIASGLRQALNASRR